MPLLEVKDLDIAFPNRFGEGQVVKGLNFTLEKGEILGLVGESGAGKSTVGNAIIDLLSPPGRVTSGDILLNGEQISGLPPETIRQVRGRRIGLIFQDPMTSLNPLFTIETQLVETLVETLGVSLQDAQSKAVELLRVVGIPEPETRIKQYPHQFSGGMRQRVVIAIALSGEPELIIADEPTTALDVSIQDQILNLIRDLCKSRQVGCILVTHDMGVIANTTDRVAVMYRGQLVEIGETKQVLEQPKHPYTQSLISAVPRSDIKLKRFPHVDYIEKEQEKPLINVKEHWLGQRQHNEISAKEVGNVSDQTDAVQPLLKVEAVNLSFETQHAFLKKNRKYLKASDNVSFAVYPGETYGLVGESGSGKSTIARVIAGLYSPDSGKILFDEFDLSTLSEQQRRPLRQQIQMVFQNPYSSLNARMTLYDIIKEPILFHGLANHKDEVKQIVYDLLDYVGLGAQAAVKYPHEFSGGQRQRISIARALATRPRLLICDEPTSALDVSVQAQILNLLKDLQEELGLTLLFISHDLPVIRQMCDRIGVMKQGAIVEEAPTEALFKNPQNEYSQRLISLMPNLDNVSRQGLDDLMVSERH
jgi:peptide/nickel transport system ATP-binding protein